MVHPELLELLARVRDGVASDDDVSAVRAGLQGVGLPADLVDGVFSTDIEEDATILMAMFGGPDPLHARLRGAVREEAESCFVRAVQVEGGVVDIAPGVLATLGARALPVGAAVGAEAGRAQELAEAVLVRSGLSEEEVPLADAVRHCAGDIDLASDVLGEIGVQGQLAEFAPPIANAPTRLGVDLVGALRSEAGDIDIAGDVCAQLGLEGDAEVKADGAAPSRDALLVSVEDTPYPIADAVQTEAGRVDIAATVLQTLALDVHLPVADAVRAEAGAVDVAETVLHMTSPAWVSAFLDHELPRAAHLLAANMVMSRPELGGELMQLAEVGRQLRTAVSGEAGELESVWPAVSQSIGIAHPEAVQGYDGALVAEAVRAEADEIDVVAIVMEHLEAQSLGVEPEVVVPANRGFPTQIFVLAALVMLALVGVTRFNASVVEDPEVAMLASASLANIQFATADELQVMDLSWGEDSSGMMFVDFDEEDDHVEPMIIWVDEEAYL